ncbi:restriction endonuclease subunit S [Acinetobacter seifertii]|uniref:restriction endonuclease subunit S n=1 Tax=Acinetobacter seifertii TaxID=1530123 RepID=UPI000D3B8665|nr:restriction endonuclease subunit S [Acinetobacter seifertii]PTV57392.1 type I restriction endonuclease subunit S [Acinetobacter seifertii]
MTDVKKLITEHLDVWLTAETEKKSGRGRSSGSNNSIYGVQKLRELILNLAVTGKLVQRSDSKAIDLIEEIKELQLSQKLKLKGDISRFSEKNKIFPANWEVIQIKQLGNVKGGKRIPKGKVFSEEVTPYVYLRVTDMKNESISDNDLKYISEEVFDEIKKYTISKNDIYITIAGTIGNVGKVPEKFHNMNLTENAAKITDLNLINHQWFIKILQSAFIQDQFRDAVKQMAQPKLAINKIEDTFIPLPPLDEQHLIAAKVDELMLLCDQLEETQNLSSEAHDQLLDTLLNALINSYDVEEFQQNWQRILENFDLLFTSEYSIELLKQTILQLAVMGKLIKQDPNDEPANELLKKITEEKARLVKEGNIKKSKPLPEISDEEKPFELPKGWSWSYLEDISLLITKGSSPKWQGINYVEKGILFITSENVGSYSLILDKEKYVEEKFNKIEPRSILQKNDFLMNIVGGSIGRTAIYDLDKTSNINQAVCLLRLLINYLDKNFLLHFFNSEICKNYMFDKQVDNARPNLSMGNIAKFIIPIPPLYEQKRIVKKVNQIFSVIEELRTLQGKLQRTKLHLADSLVANALSDSNDKSKFEVADNIVQFGKPIEIVKQLRQKSADQIDLFADDSVEDDIKLLSLAAEITFQLHTEPTFGHLKLQKLIYLCQQLKHIDLAADFKQHAAGPYDPVMARYLDKEFKNREWFSYDPKRDLKYKPLSRCNDHRSAFNRYFAEDISEIYDLIGLFRTSKSDHIEIVATLFACWLRLLEKKLSVTEEQLLKDFYAWSEEKKRFSKAEVLTGYKWMHQYSIIPQV